MRYWSEIIIHAAWINDRVVTNFGGPKKKIIMTPFERETGEAPDLSYLPIPGAFCSVLKYKVDRKKGGYVIQGLPGIFSQLL